MTKPAPKIDPRTAAGVARQVVDLLAGKDGKQGYTPDWSEYVELGSGARQATGVSGALIGVFARFADLIIQRLNQTPRKNFLAFLDLLGNSPLPPQAARVPLTFSLAAGSTADGVVPPGTQVAAPPAEGEKDPVIFETERELTVTAAQLNSVFVVEPRAGRYANRDWLVSGNPAPLIGPPDAPPNARVRPIPANMLFLAEKQIGHAFFIGSESLFGLPGASTLVVTIDFAALPPELLEIQWEAWNGVDGQPLSAMTIRAGNKWTVTFNPFKGIGQSTVNNVQSRWLRGQLTRAVTIDDDPLPGAIPAAQLPVIASISLAVTANEPAMIPERAFANLTPLDLSKEFYPFGERPRLGDAFLLEQNEAFSQADASVTIEVTLANPAVRDSKSPPAVNASDDLKLRWQYWTGRGWAYLGSSTKAKMQDDPREDESGGQSKFKDATLALTQPDKDQKVVSFKLYDPPARITINGVAGYWVRVRIVSGDYGKDARFESKVLDVPNRVSGFVLVSPPDFAPPIISSLKVSHQVTKTGAPSQAVTFNDFEYVSVNPGNPFQPFTSRSATKKLEDIRPTLYLGFTAPSGRFSQRAISLYINLEQVVYGQPADGARGSKPLRLVWEYRGKDGWAKLVVRDNTGALTRSGVIEFLPPADFVTADEFELNRYWLRVRWEEGKYQFKPLGRRLLLNTTMAAQTVTLGNEVLGSSDGSANQKFRAARAPILTGQHLEVREPEPPSAEEREEIAREEDTDAITQLRDAAGSLQEVWVRWHEVPDFYASSPRARHYVLDHLTGEIHFGDGINGLIPPVGAGNLRLSRYQTGGGAAGNKPAGAIIQLKTTVPYVDKVVNHEPAAGGADGETIESLLERAPRAIRHGNRAVTREDYEDLARLASPEVARARCEPLFNLAADPLTQQQKAGVVSVIIVPRSTDAKPLPNLELLNRVREFLDGHRLPNAELFVVGPYYVRVDVTVEIALKDVEDAGEVEAAVLSELARFLHPLTGGLDGQGWNFGRAPHKSDLYALLEAIPGVDYVRSLQVQPPLDSPEISQNQRFLVYSGTHGITLSLPADE